MVFVYLIGLSPCHCRLGMNSKAEEGKPVKTGEIRLSLLPIYFVKIHKRVWQCDKVYQRGLPDYLCKYRIFSIFFGFLSAFTYSFAQ